MLNWEYHHSLDKCINNGFNPNMRVLAPCDSNQLGFYLDEALNINGPTYIRIGKGEPIITELLKLG